MITVLLNSIALDPNRWTKEKIPFYKLERLLTPIAETGFRFVEVWQYHVSQEPEAQINAIREMGNSLGLSFPIVGFYPQLHLEGEEGQREGERIKRLFSRAKILGAAIVKIFVGTRDSALITAKEYDRSVEFMRQMTSHAEALDLTMTGETHRKTLFDTIDSCQKFMKDVNSDRFKICFQPFDLQSTDQAVSDYERVAKDVIHVHYQGHKGNSMDLLENSDLDYRRLTQVLAQNGFGGYVCIEFTKDCVVKSQSDFNLKAVLNNARRDRDFVLQVGKELNMEIQA
jgi:sugar phosphate isomerase/epimerase